MTYDLDFFQRENTEQAEEITRLGQALKMSKYHTRRLKEEKHHQAEQIDELQDLVRQLSAEVNRLRREKEEKK
ncbi:hypothetical protein FX155_07010 [Acidaminococcus fermentans]|uniref:Uncharacterized protein n=1 Tax=Acidaminococcus fermentans TaxID=905 RepID=A0A6N7VMW2_ACIFE|nr:hypothetical protein [Acidaminococcus fermentans]MSS82340.1 hypothetical protein [Acidaminococcus fermentans]